MGWIKRNLIFAIGGVVAVLLLLAAGYYDYRSWDHNADGFRPVERDLRQAHGTDGKKYCRATTRWTTSRRRRNRKRSAGMDRHGGKSFKPITPIPDAPEVSSEAFAAGLRRTIDQLQHEADAASVQLPPKYGFSFEAQRTIVKFCARQPRSAGGPARRGEKNFGNSFCGGRQHAGWHPARPGVG